MKKRQKYTSEFKSKVALEALYEHILNIRKDVLPRSLTGRACDYALGQWEQLKGYVAEGYLQIDNNLMENAIRPSALGKKNWLFIGHPQAGERSAIIYSIVVSCQRHFVVSNFRLNGQLNRGF